MASTDFVAQRLQNRLLGSTLRPQLIRLLVELIF